MATTTTTTTTTAAAGTEQRRPFPPVIDTYINYYVTPENGGHTEMFAGTAGDRLRRNDPRPVKIHDVRVAEREEGAEKFTLDRNAFQLVKWETGMKGEEFADGERVKREYYRECEEMLREVTGATKAWALSHVHRHHSHSEALEAAKSIKPHEMVRFAAPAMMCHVDSSYAGSEHLLRTNLTSSTEADRLTSTRWAIINIWRPIRPVYREPLGLIDARTLSESDLWRVPVRVPDVSDPTKPHKGVGQDNFHVTWNPEHKWWYVSELQPEEVILFKNFDSKRDGRARICPHSAFESEWDWGGARESVEVRCFVFWEDQSAE